MAEIQRTLRGNRVRGRRGEVGKEEGYCVRQGKDGRAFTRARQRQQQKTMQVETKIEENEKELKRKS